jgi:uncharacterized protein with FMN-binding domain
VRKTTKTVVGLISLGVLGASWSIGQAAESGLSLDTAGTANTAGPTETLQPTESASPSQDAGTEQAADTNQAAETATTTPTPTKTAVAVDKSVTKKSDPVSYVAEKRAGTMQISVTKTGSAITAIDIISGGTEGGQWASVPSMLAQYAIEAQGSDFGNISRATHTTDAFKEALDNALAKF